MKKHFFLILFSIFVFIGCQKNHPHLPTVKYVDIQKYKGTWYEIARFEHFFEKGCKNVSASYKILDNGEISVTNRCTKIQTNKIQEAKGIAYATDKTNSKLKVSFFRPFYGDYYIVDLKKDYSYALVGSPDREYFWILSRQKTINKEDKKDILKKASSLGFNLDKIIWTIQE